MSSRATEDDDQSQDRNSEGYSEDGEVVETCVVEECRIEDEDSNIGSMVSIQSEEIVDCNEQHELIVPEVLEPMEEVSLEEEDTIEETRTETDKEPIKTMNADALSPKHNPPDRWPTLEILPGGVINQADKTDVNLNAADQDTGGDAGDMMYACAKCSQSFKFLFRLVKHVKMHEDEAKRAKQGISYGQLSSLEKRMIFLKRERIEFEKDYKKRKLEVYSRIAKSLAQIEDLQELIN